MNIAIDRFIKELKSLNMRAYDLESVLYLLNEFTDKSNIRLVFGSKNLVFSF